MTNIDSIPYLNEILMNTKKQYLDISKSLPSKNKLKYNKKIAGVYDSYFRQGRNVSFLKLKEIIDYFKMNGVDCNELEKIYETHYFYD